MNLYIKHPDWSLSTDGVLYSLPPAAYPCTRNHSQVMDAVVAAKPAISCEDNSPLGIGRLFSELATFAPSYRLPRRPERMEARGWL
jgi:hypothetical protein